MKAGIVAGIIMGVLNAIFDYVILNAFKSQIISSINTYISRLPVTSTSKLPSAESLYNASLVTGPAEAVIFGAILGLALGYVLGRSYGKIPGGTPLIKSLFLGILIWVILDVLLGLADLGLLGTSFYLYTLGLSVISLLVFGYVLGFLYGKWAEVTPQPGTHN